MQSAAKSNCSLRTMSTIEINRVSSPKEQVEFIKFPWRIYANNPACVPPLIIERKEFLSRKHSFFEHGDAALYLARCGCDIVGRIMASDDPNYNTLQDTNTGCSGMCESLN